jgi:hypothetical protein
MYFRSRRNREDLAIAKSTLSFINHSSNRTSAMLELYIRFIFASMVWCFRLNMLISIVSCRMSWASASWAFWGCPARVVTWLIWWDFFRCSSIERIVDATNTKFLILCGSRGKPDRERYPSQPETFDISEDRDIAFSAIESQIKNPIEVTRRGKGTGKP